MAGTPSVKSQGMKFAEEQLQRHGWTEGRGLGKRESGISEAIKVKVKCDSAGVGHNSAEQFTFHWWDQVFNKTASSISVEPDQDGVQVKKVTDEDSVVTNKKPRKALTNRDMLYGRFIKSATLLSGGEQPVEKESSKESSSDSSEDEDQKLDLSSATKLTDEDLVKICGGRTAHKGARHGLTMNAKLSRIEEQERAFLEKYRKEKPNKEPGMMSLEKGAETGRKEKHKLGITNDDISSNNTQHKKKKTVNDEETLDNRTSGYKEHIPWKEEDTITSERNVDNKELVDAFNGVASSETKYSKEKKKKVVEVDHLEDYACSIEDDVHLSKKKFKEDAHDLEDHGQPLEDDIQSSKKKKKKVKEESHHLVDHTHPLEYDVQSSKKKKKKVKKDAHDLEDHAQPLEDDIQSSKNKKKKVQEAHDLENHAQTIEDDVQSSKKKKQKVKEEADLLEDHAQSIEDNVQSSKKKKRKEEKDETTEELPNGHQEWAPSEDLSLSKKKARRDLEERVEEEGDISTEHYVQSLKKKKKQKKVKEAEEHMSIEHEMGQTLKKKKSKNKFRDSSNPKEEVEQAVDNTEHTIRHKKKKRKE